MIGSQSEGHPSEKGAEGARKKLYREAGRRDGEETWKTAPKCGRVDESKMESQTEGVILFGRPSHVVGFDATLEGKTSCMGELAFCFDAFLKIEPLTSTVTRCSTPASLWHKDRIEGSNTSSPAPWKHRRTLPEIGHCKLGTGLSSNGAHVFHHGRLWPLHWSSATAGFAAKQIAFTRMSS